MLSKSVNSIALALLLAASVQLASANKTMAAERPTIDKTTVIVRANTVFYHDKSSNTFKRGWLPMMDFRVNGPVASGSLISLEMTTPDGKPWVAFDCKTRAAQEGETLKVEDCGRELPTQKLSPATGQYNLKIGLKNELQGTNQTLFAGKFKVGKVFYGDVAQDKDNYKWYVDYDWALPIAEIYSREMVDYVGNVEKASPLVATFWFRGAAGDAVAYLFYNGKEISNTETTSKGTAVGEQGVTLFDKVPFVWVKNQYHFFNVLVSNREDPDNHPNAFRMEKNPGEYEVKVLRKGKLVRAVKFTVGADGKIVANGISQQNELGTRRMTVFATVTGDEDGRQPDKEAWRTGAFFGHPLKGFGQ